MKWSIWSCSAFCRCPWWSSSNWRLDCNSRYYRIRTNTTHFENGVPVNVTRLDQQPTKVHEANLRWTIAKNQNICLLICISECTHLQYRVLPISWVNYFYFYNIYVKKITYTYLYFILHRYFVYEYFKCKHEIICISTYILYFRRQFNIKISHDLFHFL